MGRKKVNLELITNDSVRKTTFRKRKNGLLKKASELKTLCGVDACAIIYNTNDPQPHAWPSSAETHQVIERFHSLPPKKQTKHMQNLDDSRPQDLSSLELKLEEAKKRNRDLEMELLTIDHLSGKNLSDSINPSDYLDLRDYLDEQVGEYEAKIETLKANEVEEGIRSMDVQN